MSQEPASGVRTEPCYYLGIFDDHLRGIPLHSGTIVIGRSKSNHLQLHDHLLSRKHCSLSVAGDRITLVDLNSSNGTYVNGERVGTQELSLDDIVELGKTVMVLYDGSSWGRGEGLMNLRHPIKAQELVHRLGENEVAMVGVGDADPDAPRGGVRAKKGLTTAERSFLRWLESGETRVLPQLVTEYLTHKLVSLLVRNSKPVRAAFTTVLEEMMRPQFFQRFGNVVDLEAGIAELVERELSDLRDAPEPEEAARDLLEEAEDRPDGNGPDSPPVFREAGDDTPASADEPEGENS